MSIAIPCPKCGKLLRIPNESLLGKVGRCPKCEHKFILQEPEAEVPLELVETPAASQADHRLKTPKVGTAAQWVPDQPTAAASPGPEALSAGIPTFGSPLESTSRTKRKRKKASLQQRIVTLAGLVIVIVGAAYAYNTYIVPAANQQAAQAKKVKKAKPSEVDSEQASLEDDSEKSQAVAEAEHKFGRPTNGKPIDLLWVPTGARIIINMRPAELWKAGNKGEGEFVSALGPIRNWMETSMAEFLKAKPEEIEELLLCVIPGQRGSPPDYAAVVRRTKDHKFKKSDLMEGMTAVSTGPVKYYVNEKWAMAFQPDLITYSIAPASAGAEMVNAATEPQPNATEIEEILRFTDRSMHFTVVCVPTDLNLHGEVLVPANVQPLLESLRVWISNNDVVESAAWAFHLTEDKFYSQLMLRNRGLMRPHLLSKNVQTHLAELPHQILELVEFMNPTKLGPRKVIGRFPAMVKVVQMGTKFQTDKQLVSLAYSGPERAGPNLALGALLAWDEGVRTNYNASPTGTTVAAQSKKSLTELLKSKIDVDFRREPLENAFKFIAGEAKFEIEVDGDGLKTAGYTKNMPQTFQAEGIAASSALAKIQSSYGQMCFVVDESKNLVKVTVLEKAKAQNEKVIVFK